MLGRSGSVLLPAGGVKGRRVKGRDPVTSVSVVAASHATVLPSSAFNSGSGITVVSGSTRVIGLTGSDLGGGGGGTAARRGGSAGRVRGDGRQAQVDDRLARQIHAKLILYHLLDLAADLLFLLGAVDVVIDQNVHLHDGSAQVVVDGDLSTLDVRYFHNGSVDLLAHRLRVHVGAALSPLHDQALRLLRV